MFNHPLRQVVLTFARLPVWLKLSEYASTTKEIYRSDGRQLDRDHTRGARGDAELRYRVQIPARFRFLVPHRVSRAGCHRDNRPDFEKAMHALRPPAQS